MPRFFFDVSDADGFHRDEVGGEFDCLDEAREQCQAILGDVMREELPNGEKHAVSCDVRDESGTTVYQGSLAYEGK